MKWRAFCFHFLPPECNNQICCVQCQSESLWPSEGSRAVLSLWASEGSRDFVVDPQSDERHENLSKFQLHELTGFVAFLAKINIRIVQNEVNDGSDK